MLEHGGNLRAAAHAYGRPVADWLDLSAGLNPHWYPAPALDGNAWHRLPEVDDALLHAACTFYGAQQMLAVAGTQAAIQALPHLRAPSQVVVAAPSYAEHAHHWRGHGHTLREVPYADLDAAVDTCDVLVVCNPNNPTGATVPAATLLAWSGRLAARGGWLIVDEAFADTAPQHSVAAHSAQDGLIVLRSLGKFFGLAGVRVGFAGAAPALLERLADWLGPWTVSGPAQQVARAALSDFPWHRATRAKLASEGARLRTLLALHGIASHGTDLFQWWPEPDAVALHAHMATRGIWVRLFTSGARGIRFGLPPDEAAWGRLADSFNDWTRRT
jgi:cobalamin biosynthetic protein CobC